MHIRPQAPGLHSKNWKAESCFSWSGGAFQLVTPVPCLLCIFPQWNRTINKLWSRCEPKFQQKQYYLWIWIEGHKLSKHIQLSESWPFAKYSYYSEILFFLLFSIIFFMFFFFLSLTGYGGHSVTEYSLILILLLIFLNIHFTVTVHWSWQASNLSMH